MLSWLDGTRRVRAATIVAAVYAVCVLAPVGAFAVGDAASGANCLGQDHHSVAAVHTHIDGTSHKHSDDGKDGQTKSGTCCGLACFFAIAPTLQWETGHPVAAPIVSTLSEDGLMGRGQDRLNRPPISLLSL